MSLEFNFYSPVTVLSAWLLVTDEVEELLAKGLGIIAIAGIRASWRQPCAKSGAASSVVDNSPKVKSMRNMQIRDSSYLSVMAGLSRRYDWAEGKRPHPGSNPLYTAAWFATANGDFQKP
jgi:hypothetical protein